MMLYTESVEDQTDHFADAFVRVNVAYSYDVMTFKSTQPMDNLMFLQRFQ